MFASIFRAILVAILSLIFRAVDAYGRARNARLRKELARVSVRDRSRDYMVYNTRANVALGFFAHARDVTDTYNQLVKLNCLSAQSLHKALPGCAAIRARLCAPFDDVIVHIALANVARGEDSVIKLEFVAR